MPFNEQLPEWNAPGVEPPASKKSTGWQAGEKPPADYWNWQMHRTYKALEELQQKAAEKEDVATKADLAAHTAATTGVHGATSTATPNTLVQRDADGEIAVSGVVSEDGDVNIGSTSKGEVRYFRVRRLMPIPNSSDSEQIEGELFVQQDQSTNTVAIRRRVDGENAGVIRIFGPGDVRTDNNNKIWHAGNDGAGSGLDADLLDGMHASNFWTKSEIPYETGTWTPIITSTSGSNNHTYGSQSGRYVKMGNLVFVWGNVSLTAKDPGMAGNLFFGGLPFLVANDGHYPAANIGYYRNVALGNSNQLTARFDQNSTVVSFWENGDNLGALALLASKITDTTQFAIGGVYKTND